MAFDEGVSTDGLTPRFVEPWHTERFEGICELARSAREIVVCAHTSADGDAIGSTVALVALLRAKWPEAQVTGLLADNAPVPRIYRFLAGTDELVCAADYTGSPDLFVAVDLSAAHRLADAEAVLKRSKTSAIIDHHPCDEPFADVFIIRPEAAAAGVIVQEFAEHLGVPLTQEVAQALLCALITDTGRFQYQNTNAEALQSASLLVAAGASPAEVSLNVYQSFRLEFLHLKAQVMARVVTFAHGRIAYSYTTEADLARTGASLDEADGLVDVVRSVAGAEVALFLKEVPGGSVRGNLRSKTDLDVSGVARELGGGGHRAAAGFTVDADIDEALSRALPKLRALFPDEVASAGGTTVMAPLTMTEAEARAAAAGAPVTVTGAATGAAMASEAAERR
jgi:phosphoesterase RecJ-like protein